MKKQAFRGMTLLVALLLCTVCLFPAAQADSRDVICTSDNPIPAIAGKVRPAVVQVIPMARTWSREYGVLNEEIGCASGIYIDAEGYIITNYHVISEAETVEIVTLSGERLAVSEITYDENTDLALLRLEKPLEGVEPVAPGNSDELVIGELAIVIGIPAERESLFFSTVTAGIVSGLRHVAANADHSALTVDAIQIDTSIRSGSSGGALLNARGELMGISTPEYDAASGAYVVTGYCIPSNTIVDVLADLKQFGVVQRPRMGILITEWEGPDEPIPGYPPAGLLVNEVEENTPAAQSGLKPYDLITHINGIRVSTFTDLSDITDRMEAGDILHLTVYRCYDPRQDAWLPNPETLEFDIELMMLDN